MQWINPSMVSFPFVAKTPVKAFSKGFLYAPSKRGLARLCQNVCRSYNRRVLSLLTAALLPRESLRTGADRRNCIRKVKSRKNIHENRLDATRPLKCTQGAVYARYNEHSKAIEKLQESLMVSYPMAAWPQKKFR